MSTNPMFVPDSTTETFTSAQLEQVLAAHGARFTGEHVVILPPGAPQSEQPKAAERDNALFGTHIREAIRVLRGTK